MFASYYEMNGKNTYTDVSRLFDKEARCCC